MATQRYDLVPLSHATLLELYRSGQLAYSPVQRPYVWSANLASLFVDSLYRGYVIPPMILQRFEPDQAQHGCQAGVQMMVVDGKQRLACLAAALYGVPVREGFADTGADSIAFNPQSRKFAPASAATCGKPGWLPDIAVLFREDAEIKGIAQAYCQANPQCNPEQITAALARIRTMLDKPYPAYVMHPDVPLAELGEVFLNANETAPESRAEVRRCIHAIVAHASQNTIAASTLHLQAVS